MEKPPNTLEISFVKSDLSFDDVMMDIGFQKYQLYLLLILSPIAIADGTEALVLSMLIPIFENEWNATEFQLSLLGSLVFFGYLIGSLIAGPIADKYGRKKPLIISTFIWTIFAFLSALAANIYDFMFYRFIFGIVVGFIWPVGFSLLTEYCPVDKRGKYLNTFQLFYPIGEILAVFLAMLTLTNLKSGNWRILLGFSSVPAFLSFIFCCYYVDESARFLLQDGNFEEGFRTINKIAKMNKGIPKYLNEEKQRLLIEWSNDFLEFSPYREPLNKKLPSIISNFFTNTYGKISELFKNDLKSTTLIIWYSWFANVFVYYGVTFATPLTLVTLREREANDQANSIVDDDFKTLMYSNISEIFSCVACAIMVDLKFLGRKYSLIISSGLTGVFSIFLFFKLPPNYVFWVSTLKFISGLVNCINYLYTSEFYPTKIRATGVGMASSVCRIAPMIVPWAVVYFTKIYVFLPYLVFGIIGGSAAFVLNFIQKETCGRELDYVIKH